MIQGRRRLDEGCEASRCKMDGQGHMPRDMGRGEAEGQIGYTIPRRSDGGEAERAVPV